MLDFGMGRRPGRTYRYYEGIPLFRFGHGLNPLTTFEIRSVDPRSRRVDISQYNQVNITVSVTNTGKSEGSEVIMAYFIPIDIPISEPAFKLKEQLFGFERVHLLPSESEEVTFSISKETLQLADNFGTPKTFSGRYTIQLTNGMDLTQRTVLVGT